MDFLTVKRLTATLLPIVSLCLLIGALAVDEWYSISYTEGEKDHGELWESYDVDYGVQEFGYLEVWSGFFGDNYYQENSTYNGPIQETFSYVMNSSIFIILLHIPLLIFGALVTADRARPWIPMVLALIILLGIVIASGYFFLNIEEAVNDHIDTSFNPLNRDLDNDIKDELKGTGTLGTSFYLFASSAILPLLSLMLLLEARSEKKPSSDQIQDGFFK